MATVGGSYFMATFKGIIGLLGWNAHIFFILFCLKSDVLYSFLSIFISPNKNIINKFLRSLYELVKTE